MSRPRMSSAACMYLVMYPHHVAHHLNMTGKKARRWVPVRHRPSHHGSRTANIKAVMPNGLTSLSLHSQAPSQSDHGRKCLTKVIHGSRGFVITAAAELAACSVKTCSRSAVLEAAGKSSCMHECESARCMRTTHADFGRGTTRAHPVNAATGHSAYQSHHAVSNYEFGQRCR
jgi:hypothetical protein